MNANGELRELDRAARRLAESDTPRKRRNSRLAVKRAWASLWRLLDLSYPALRPDGSEIRPQKVKGKVCPHCDAPMKSAAVLKSHLLNRHGYKNYTVSGFHRCLCGKKLTARHLAGVKDLAVHFAAARLRQASEPDISTLDTSSMQHVGILGRPRIRPRQAYIHFRDRDPIHPNIWANAKT